MSKNNKRRTALVTGAAGFIGFHTAKRLIEDGWTVVGFDNLCDYYDPRLKRKRLSFLKEHPNFQFKKGSVAKFDVFEKLVREVKPDEIIHLAAQAGVRYSITNPWAYFESNELGTLNVFEVARRMNIPRVVYASSSSVYGTNSKLPMSESDRADSQVAVYGATKKANESLAHAYNHLYKMEMIGLRFFTVYGSWDRPDLALFKFTKNILAGKTIDVYNRGQMKRSFTHVSDIVSGVAAVLDVTPSGRNEIYNLGGAEAVPLLQFIEHIEKAAGKKAKKHLMPMQAGDMQATVADWRKARRDLGFSPKTPIEEGIADYVVWFKENEAFLSSLTPPKQ